MKKVVFLLHLPPPVHGSAMVGKSIRESLLINKHFKCRYINILASKQVTEAGSVSLLKLTGFISTWTKVFVTLLMHRPDLCYLALTTTGAGFYKDLMLIVLIRLMGIRRVYHLHNKGISQHLNHTLYRLCYRYAFKNAEVILLSPHLYDDLKPLVSRNKISICPNGIVADDKEKLYQKQPQEGKVQLLFLSNLMVSKGIEVLLEACVILKSRGLMFDCTIIGGEGDFTAAMLEARIHQLDLDDQVKYPGKKFGKDKEDALQSADIFIHPTYSDCFPLVILEAMSHSLPVVSVVEGGIPDMVENGRTGFLVPPKNTVLLAEKTELLIQNVGLRLQMGNAAREKYNREFTLDKFENRLLSILQNSAQEVDKKSLQEIVK